MECRGGGRRRAVPVDPLGGQKTGWFSTSGEPRSRRGPAEGARVLDVFCHVGAFLRCARPARAR
jgi:23S rRNA (cytosine1962-C5)-methyltransferase